jgi:hypothetical protein
MKLIWITMSANIYSTARLSQGTSSGPKFHLSQLLLFCESDPSQYCRARKETRRAPKERISGWTIGTKPGQRLFIKEINLKVAVSLAQQGR